MRTTLDLDPELIEEARRISNGKSKKAVIEEALREFVKAKERGQLVEMIRNGEIELDLTLEELWKMRGCDVARTETARRERRRARAG